MAIFNPRQAVQKLRDRGLEEPVADGIVEVVEEATTAATDDLATKADLATLESRIDARFAEAEARNEARANRTIVVMATVMGVIAAIALAIAQFT